MIIHHVCIFTMHEASDTQVSYSKPLLMISISIKIFTSVEHACLNKTHVFQPLNTGYNDIKRDSIKIQKKTGVFVAPK